MCFAACMCCSVEPTPSLFTRVHHPDYTTTSYRVAPLPAGEWHRPGYMVAKGRRRAFASITRYIPRCFVALVSAYLFFGHFLAGSGVLGPTASTSTSCPEKYHPFFTAYHLKQINARRIVKGAAEVAEQVKRGSPSNREGTPTVVLFLSDAKYGVRFPEMIKTWSHFVGKSSLVMLALDDATDALFRAQGIPTIRVIPEEMKLEQSIREAVLQAKVVVPYVFLLKGLRVVMVEMDVYCRSNPLRFDNGTAEILVTEHDKHSDSREVNVGFWIAHPTCPVIDSFRRMQAWATDPHRKFAYCDEAFDQKLMHFAWLGGGPIAAGSKTRCQRFSQRNQIFDPRVDKPLAVQSISFEHIMHWNDPPAQDRDTWPNSPNTICVHLWSGFGNATAQARYGYAHGWYPPESETEAKEAMVRLQSLDI